MQDARPRPKPPFPSLAERNEKSEPLARPGSVAFLLKNNMRVDWLIADLNQFNFFMMVKAIRADGHFVSEGIYIRETEIAAIVLNPPNEVADIHSKGRFERVN